MFVAHCRKGFVCLSPGTTGLPVFFPWFRQARTGPANRSAAAVALTIDGSGQAPTVNVGSQAPNLNSTLAAITAPVTVTNRSGNLNVDDSGDSTAQTGTLSSTQITGLGLGSGGNIFRISPFTQYLAASIVGPLTLNGGGSDILELFDANDPNSETFTLDPAPMSLTLGSTGSTIADFYGMGGGVYVVTNGFSTPNDQSGTVIFDPSGGPLIPQGHGPSTGPNPGRQALIDAALAQTPPASASPSGDLLAESTLPDNVEASLAAWPPIAPSGGRADGSGANVQLPEPPTGTGKRGKLLVKDTEITNLTTLALLDADRLQGIPGLNVWP
jgi:hypothetical protein